MKRTSVWVLLEVEHEDQVDAEGYVSEVLENGDFQDAINGRAVDLACACASPPRSQISIRSLCKNGSRSTVASAQRSAINQAPIAITSPIVRRDVRPAMASLWTVSLRRWKSKEPRESGLLTIAAVEPMLSVSLLAGSFAS
jgi:hypothetical protein